MRVQAGEAVSPDFSVEDRDQGEGSSQRTFYPYHNGGNMMLENSGSTTTIYTFDGHNRLVKVTQDGTVIAEYVRDALDDEKRSGIFPWSAGASYTAWRIGSGDWLPEGSEGDRPRAAMGPLSTRSRSRSPWEARWDKLFGPVGALVGVRFPGGNHECKASSDRCECRPLARAIPRRPADSVCIRPLDCRFLQRRLRGHARRARSAGHGRIRMPGVLHVPARFPRGNLFRTDHGRLG